MQECMQFALGVGVAATSSWCVKGTLLMSLSILGQRGGDVGVVGQWLAEWWVVVLALACQSGT